MQSGLANAPDHLPTLPSEKTFMQVVVARPSAVLHRPGNSELDARESSTSFEGLAAKGAIILEGHDTRWHKGTFLSLWQTI